MSIDHYFGRTYRPGQYNCLHFAADVWRDLTGEDLHEHLAGLIGGRLGDRAATRHTLASFTFLDKPHGRCLVLMQRPRRQPHIGVWLNGSVLHLQSTFGVQFMPLHIAAFGFKKVRFFVPK